MAAKKKIKKQNLENFSKDRRGHEMVKVTRDGREILAQKKHVGAYLVRGFTLVQEEPSGTMPVALDTDNKE